MIHLLIFLGTMAVFGRCRATAYEPNIDEKLMEISND